MTAAKMIAAGALSAALAVAIGAFGAHGLKDRLAPDLLEIFETGVRYHFYAAFGLVAAGLAAERRVDHRGGRVAAWSFLLGTLFFSGSLYLLAVTGARWLGAVTPIGGVALIVAFVALARAAGVAIFAPR